MSRAHNDHTDKLTPHERRIYLLIASEGLRDREVAERLHYTLESVKHITKLILHKMGHRSRLALAVAYWKQRAERPGEERRAS
jgi:DNA-binding NarL/FixJ family response regulator